MVAYAGPRWQAGEATEWRVRLEGDLIVEEGPDEIGAGAEPAVFFDGLVNWHAHLGDAFLQGRPRPRDLAELVRPETGWKHIQLARASRQEIRDGIVETLRAFARHGIADVFDFREQGPDGLLVARDALARAGPQAPRVHLLGRPARLPWTPSELAALFHLGDGVGLPSLSDWGPTVCRSLAELAHQEARFVALHLSEAHRESVEDALSLQPDLLIHLCKAEPADLRRVRDADVPVVVCPKSNDWFGLRPPVPGLERLGVPWLLGTDNAMLGSVDLLREAALLQEWYPDLASDALCRALTRRPGKVINRMAKLKPRRLAASPLAILPRRGDGAPEWTAPPIYARR